MNTKQTILIVDDNISNLDILIEILTMYDVITLTDGREISNILNKEDIDLILLDIMMPHIDGFQACTELKQNTNYRKIPIIFLSAKNQIDDIKKGFELGAVDFITKPFNPMELLSRVDTHLRLRKYEKNLELELNDKLNTIRLQEQIIYQQAKQTEMGQMLMHIAHQWKQPLSEIGSINTLNLAKMKLDIPFEKDQFIKSFEQIANVLRFMSNTVETFRSFYMPTSLKNSFTISEAIHLVRQIIGATFDYNSITLDVTINEEKTISGNINEISQVLLSILNNAKDILILRKIKNKKISIIVDIVDEKLQIQIVDNAGGIRFTRGENIFDPYVSSKNSSGIGLYMSKMILQKYNASINAHNIDNGAKFTIIF